MIRGLAALALALICALFAVGAEEPSGTAPAEETAELRIGLPASAAPSVKVGFGEGAVTLDLPHGATFPLDIVAAAKGLLRSAQTQALSDDRVRLELVLAGGMCDSVELQGQAVVVTLSRRGGIADDSGGTAGQYRIGPEDKLQITVTVTGRPDLVSTVVVGSAGKITAPLVGETTAGGMTVRELTARLTELLARDYLVDPQVDVQVTEYKSKWVMVTGEVRTPGRVALRGPATLKDVIADAGGMMPDAGQEIVVSRAGGGAELSPALVVERERFERGEVNPPVSHGDIVSVRPAAFAFVEGEVRLSGKVKVEKNMTLLKALAMAGGLTEWANRKAVQVRSGDPQSSSATYNLNEIESHQVPDPPILGGEVIIVRRRLL